MKNSFMDNLKSKESQKQASVQAEPATAEPTVQAIAESPEEIVAEEPLEVGAELSDDVKKKLAGPGSFMDKLKEKAQAEAEQELAEEEEIEEEQEEIQAEAPVPVSFQVEDQTFDSPEMVNEYLAKVRGENAELQAEVEEIRGFVEKISDPDMLELLKYVNMGYSTRVAMVKAGFDESMFHIEHDDVDAKDLVRAQLEREQAIKDQEKEQKVLQKNMERSNVNLTEFATEKGMDDTKKKTLVDQMAKIHQELMNGLVTKETLEIFTKGLNYESAIQKTKEVTALQTKNEKIVMERQKQQAATIPQLGRGVPAERKQLKDLVTVRSGSFMDKVKARTAQK